MAKENKPPPIIEPPEPDTGRRLPPWTWILPTTLVVLVVLAALRTFGEAHEVDYSTFKRAVRAGRVVEVAIGPDTVAGRLRWTAALADARTSSAARAAGASSVGAATGAASATVASATPRAATATAAVPAGRRFAEGAEVTFRTVLVHDPDLYADLEANGVAVRGVARTDWSLPMLALTLIGLPLLLMSMLSRRMRDAQGGVMGVGKSRAKIAVETDVKISFKDVAGVDEAKAELSEVVEYLKTPEKFTRLGGKIPKGVLLVGPPGTGKTLLAKAVAGEAGVPFFFISGSDFVEMFVGVGAARVRDLFAEARKKAPCIIFIDELDALGKARGNGPMAHEEREQTLNQLLVELDGFDGRAGVILLGATNRPEILDPALLRAGRFDRNVLVDRPDKPGRRAILELHAKHVPLADVRDLDELAGLTAGFAGAELANVINEAALLAVRRDKDVVGKDELLEAVERVVAGLEKKNRTLGKKERDIVAHHEVGHALVAMAMPGADPVRKISIIPRGVAALGYTLQMPSEDRFLMTKAELEARIATLLGGRIAEEVVFGEISTGARDDLRKATDLARSMATLYGMSDAIGRVSYERDDRGQGFLGGGRSSDDASEATRREIDVEIRRILDAQYERARAILRGEEGALRRAAAVLLEREVISGEELLAVVEEHRRATRAGALGLSDS